jgi:acyl-CoA reductase-like NAD-dependent aldehyde dehydrogenase
VTDFTMTIDGKAESAQRSFGVINPATGEVFASAPDCTRAQLESALESAQTAFRAWRKDEARRRQGLLDCAAAIQARAGELVPLLTREQGKPLAKAMMEVMGSAIWFQYTASLSLPVEVIQDDENARIEVRRRPLGVVGAITPWNFPLLLGVWKLAPALLAGNTVVIKPSPFTPLSTLKLVEILRPVLPAGVLNAVSGGDELGAWITASPIPRKISFTGSIATGKKVAAAAAPDLKRLTLELGGNDPAIVLGDVDPKAVAKKLFASAFENCGQVCTAIKRVYVPEELYASVVDELAELANAIVVGNGEQPGVELGPINNKPQFERVKELVEEARASGARIVTGGRTIGDKGYFYAPTIVADIAEGTRLVDEEQFGPALPVIAYRRIEDAIERANATHFGLGASVWSSDRERAAEIAGELECGSAWVNTHLALAPNIPFGGAKWSGIGVENGSWGLLGFTEIQVVNVNRGA